MTKQHMCYLCCTGAGAAAGGDAVELLETGSLEAAVNQAMVSEPQDEEISETLRGVAYNRQTDVAGESPQSDKAMNDFSTVHAGLSAIGARETSSD